MQEKAGVSSTKNFVKIPNQWFAVDSGQSFSTIYGEKGLVLLIRMLQQINRRGQYIITEHHIKEWFQYNHSRYYKGIFQILDLFKQDEIFLFEQDYDFNTMFRGLISFQPAPILLSSEKFFFLYDYEVDSILINYDGNMDKYKLLSLFACLKFHYNMQTKLCSPSLDILSSETRLSENTIQTYLDVLVDLGLIFYGNPGTKLFPDGSVNECNNIYTMNYGDNKALLEQEIKRVQQELAQLEKEEKLKVINSELGNLKKSIKMKMYWLPKKLESGKITQAEHDAQYCELQEEYDRLVEEQKSLQRNLAKSPRLQSLG